ncbi:MAG: fibronectin type III domain-containing protein [Actinomycetota bacterium]|nr:fibronectin type III domain-containing protein [Actinomycetota bacterium]
MYVYEFRSGGVRQISRYEPTVYKPDEGEIVYGKASVVAVPEEVPVGNTSRFLPSINGLAVDRTTDRLFVHFADAVFEFGSAAEENKLLNTEIGKGVLSFGKWVEIDASRRLIYASDSENSLLTSRVRVFEADAPYALVRTIDGSTTPAGKFQSTAGFVSIAVDEGSGNVFIDDLEKAKKVYEFTETGEYVSTIEHSFQYVIPSEIEVDNGINSPNGALNPAGRYLFVPSHPSGVGHAFAFAPVAPPVLPSVDSITFADMTDTEAELRALIDPNNTATKYRIEYTSLEDESFSEATVAEEGTLPLSDVGVPVSVSLSGLTPGAGYRFRVVAENEVGEDSATSQFSTYAAVASWPPCGNDQLRLGASALLPDCRAYELVTPPSTNGRPPQGVSFVGDRFPTVHSSPLGDKVSFLVEGGTIPGNEGTGAFNGDRYLATRGSSGWGTASAGPNGEESMAPLPGSFSADQGYSFWSTSLEDEGSAATPGVSAHYVRYPNGHSEPVGRGSLGEDPADRGVFIAPGGTHIIFATETFPPHEAIPLEPNAPPAGTDAVYDRTSDEITHVVSLLPGDVTPAAGEDATYEGASDDGEGIAFSIGNTLYLRLDNSETFEVATGAWSFAGVAESGSRVFYVQGGNLFAFDTETEATIPFAGSGNAVPVNVSKDGSRAYFISSSVLTSTEENPVGDTAQAGKPNLYLSEEGAISFVATVTETDVKRKNAATGDFEGLGTWTEAVSSGRLAKDPSRVTPDGTVLLFESRADLTGSSAGGFVQVYRYDSAAGTLSCLSCNPTGTPATTDASLQPIADVQLSLEPFSSFGYVPSLRADGRRAFFQTSERLVVNDTDERQDIYEWEAVGVGSCEEAGGCTYLISSGRSAKDDYLFAVSESGDDVFFLSGDLLLPADAEGTLSIYDARVGGGFPEPVFPDPCQGESCRPQMTLPPPPLTPAPPSAGDDNVPKTKRVVCPKGKRKVKRHGKVRCVKKHRKSASRKGGGK